MRTKKIKETLDLIQDEDAKVLSFLYLGGNEKKIPQEIKTMLKARALVKENKDSSLSINDECLDIVSDYPLFGEYKKTKPYPQHVLPFLFGMIAEGYVQSDRNKAASYLKSDYFTSLFPEGEAFEKGAIKALYSMSSLSLVYSDSAHLKLHRENILKFYALSEESKLSYLIKPHASIGERESLTNAINLAFRLRKVKNLEAAFAVIEAITHFDLNTITDSLFDFGILYKDEDGFEGYELSLDGFNKAVLTSDYTLSYSGFCKDPLFLFLKPIKADKITQWLIDKNTLKAAFSMGYKTDDIISMLDNITEYGVPETIRARINAWYEQYKSVIVQRALILTADEKNSRILDNLPLLKIHILSKPADNVYIMNPDTEEEWRKILTYSGYDMLGATQGPVFTDFPLSYPFHSNEMPKNLNRERTIPYNSDKLKSLIASAKSDQEKLLIKTGVYKPGEIALIEGLYFQEKLRVMQEAINLNRLVIAIDVDDKAEIYKPISLEKNEETIIETNIGKKSLDKIWKLGLLPEYVIDRPQCLLDSDIQ